MSEIELWRHELDDARLRLDGFTNANGDGFALWRHQVNTLISEIHSPKGTLAIRFNGLEWGNSSAHRSTVWSPDVRRPATPIASGGFEKTKATANEILDTLSWELERRAPKPDPINETSIDSELWEYVRVLVENGEWDKVALQACVFVEGTLRSWCEISPSEAKTSVEVFKKAISPDKFRLGATESEEQGWRQLATGFSMALRNPNGHRIEGRDDAKRYAVGVLGTASLLLTESRHAYGDTPTAL